MVIKHKNGILLVEDSFWKDGCNLKKKTPKNILKWFIRNSSNTIEIQAAVLSLIQIEGWKWETCDPLGQ